MVVALLAVLKSGAAYVPLDPAFPADRLAFMVADTALSVIVTSAGALTDRFDTTVADRDRRRRRRRHDRHQRPPTRSRWPTVVSWRT